MSIDSEFQTPAADGPGAPGPGEAPSTDPESAPLFRNAGGREAAAEALTQMEGIMDDFLSFESAAGS